MQNIESSWEEKMDEGRELEKEREKLVSKDNHGIESEDSVQSKLNIPQSISYTTKHDGSVEDPDKEGWMKRFQAQSVVYRFLPCDSGWLPYLVNAARALLTATAANDMVTTGLARLGRRRGRTFLGHKCNHPPSVFGLKRPSTKLRLITDAEQRILVLRKITRQCRLNGLAEGAVLIRYFHLPPITEHVAGRYEYTTAIPHTRYMAAGCIRSSLPEE
jgi:hypothetical protein